MRRTLNRCLPWLLVGGSGWAAAAQHHICYEGPSYTVVFGCRDDAGASCTVTPLTYNMRVSAHHIPGSAPGSFTVFNIPNSGSYAAQIDYQTATGAVSRICQVNALPPQQTGAASQGAELVGFATDTSGMATSGVWKLSTTQQNTWSRLSIDVPADFVAVGGGAVGTDLPFGALVTESFQADVMGVGNSGNWRRWMVRTADLAYANPHFTTAYAIGLRITRSHPGGTDVPATDLSRLLRTKMRDNFAPAASVASNQASMPVKVIGGFVPLSGSVRALADPSNASPNLLGQYVTVSAPLHDPCPTVEGCKLPPIKGWRVESKDHPITTPHPGTVDTALLGIASSIMVDGTAYRVIGRYAMATSAMVAHPSIDVSLPGYALTGIGAAVAWRDAPPKYGTPPAGNLVWKLEPRPDLGGATVTSKDHGLQSPAAITAYALGIKLVP